MKYYTSSGVDICEMPVTDFKVLMVNKPKKSAWSKNYANAGFFGNYGTFTLPAAHLICDFETTNADCKKYHTNAYYLSVSFFPQTIGQDGYLFLACP